MGDTLWIVPFVFLQPRYANSRLPAHSRCGPADLGEATLIVEVLLRYPPATRIRLSLSFRLSSYSSKWPDGDYILAGLQVYRLRFPAPRLASSILLRSNWASRKSLMRTLANCGRGARKTAIAATFLSGF